MNLRKTFNRISKFFLGSSSADAGLWGWSIPGQWAKKDLLKQYGRYVYAVVSAIAEEAAKVSFEVEKKGASGVLLPVKSHQFLDLIRKPNPAQSQFQFLEMHFTYMKVAGESFWYMAKGEKSKKPKELYLLRPDLVEPVVGKTLENGESNNRGAVTAYKYKLPNKEQTFKPDEILHHKMPNPNNPQSGFGPVQAGKTYVETEDYAAHFTRNSIFNSGRPSGVLNVKGSIDKEQFEIIKRQFKDQYTGTKNAGKTMLLRGVDGFDYQKLGMELGEVALKDMKNMTRDDIMIMFRVSKTILGITDDVNRANAHEARIVFTENVIKPELDRLVDHLNSFLMPIWGEGFVLEYTDPTLVSDTDRLEMYKAGHNKWLTTNDIREELGYKKLPGGDVIREPLNIVPTTTPVKESLQKRLKKKDLNRKARASAFMTLLFENQEKWEALYKKTIDEEFGIQKKEILKKNPVKSVKKNLQNWIFDLVASKQRLMAVLVPFGLELIREQAVHAFDMAGDEDTELIVDQRISQYVSDRIDHLADETNDETIKKITESLSEGITNGDSIYQLRKRINEIYDNATKVRSERIARTETLAASNEGALSAYRQSPFVKQMEWSAEFDACEFCIALDGVVVGLEETFAPLGGSVDGADGGSYLVSYESITHPPLHPNCRCSILPVG